MAAATKTRRRPTRSRRRSKQRRSESNSLGSVVSGAMEKMKDVLPAVGRLLTGNIDVNFHSLRDLFIKELEDLYSAEHQLLRALPKMAAAATAPALRNAFEAHRRETEGHVTRLDEVFHALDMVPRSTKCMAMDGLITEGNEWVREPAEPGVKDAGLIAAAQRVEHYEMAGYGCVRTYAQLLGHRDVAALLQATLDEEGGADKKLTRLAKRINVAAEGPKPAHRSRNGKAPRRAK
jgi:ferritin-like metal-binding protein YciE